MTIIKNICDKYYYAADDTNDYDEHYDGDVCHLCLPEIISKSMNTDSISDDNLFVLNMCSDNI